jgi:hypothetical protein
MPTAVAMTRPYASALDARSTVISDGVVGCCPPELDGCSSPEPDGCSPPEFVVSAGGGVSLASVGSAVGASEASAVGRSVVGIDVGAGVGNSVGAALGALVPSLCTYPMLRIRTAANQLKIRFPSQTGQPTDIGCST